MEQNRTEVIKSRLRRGSHDGLIVPLPTVRELSKRNNTFLGHLTLTEVV